MSTRANIHFEQYGGLQANVYRHSDGYPAGLGRDLETFLDDVAANVQDTRFDDAEYLAAKFLVWQAQRYARKLIHAGGGEWTYEPAHPLDFLGVSPCIEDHGDIEYRYRVRCTGTERPTVTWEEVKG